MCPLQKKKPVFPGKNLSECRASSDRTHSFEKSDYQKSHTRSGIIKISGYYFSKNKKTHFLDLNRKKQARSYGNRWVWLSTESGIKSTIRKSWIIKISVWTKNSQKKCLLNWSKECGSQKPKKINQDPVEDNSCVCTEKGKSFEKEQNKGIHSEFSGQNNLTDKRKFFRNFKRNDQDKYKFFGWDLRSGTSA